MGLKIWDEMSDFLFLRGQVWSIDVFRKTKHVQRCQHFYVSCWALYLFTQLLMDLIALLNRYRTILLAPFSSEMSGLFLVRAGQGGKGWDAPRQLSSGGADHWKTEWALWYPGTSLRALGIQEEPGRVRCIMSRRCSPASASCFQYSACSHCVTSNPLL